MDTTKNKEILALKELIVKQDAMIEAQKELIATLKNAFSLRGVPNLSGKDTK